MAVIRTREVEAGDGVGALLRGSGRFLSMGACWMLGRELGRVVKRCSSGGWSAADWEKRRNEAGPPLLLSASHLAPPESRSFCST